MIHSLVTALFFFFLAELLVVDSQKAHKEVLFLSLVLCVSSAL
jgi:hypothetical protein